MSIRLAINILINRRYELLTNNKLLTDNNTIASGSQSTSDLQTDASITTCHYTSESSHVSCIFNSLVHLFELIRTNDKLQKVKTIFMLSTESGKFKIIIYIITLVFHYINVIIYSKYLTALKHNSNIFSIFLAPIYIINSAYYFRSMPAVPCDEIQFLYCDPKANKYQKESIPRMSQLVNDAHNNNYMHLNNNCKLRRFCCVVLRSVGVQKWSRQKLARSPPTR